MKKIFERYKFIMILVGILFVSLFIFLNQKKETNKLPESFNLTKMEQPDKEENSKEKIEKPLTIFVDVKGQVAKPGIYEGKDGERVQDLISRAGGFLKSADQNQVNLAQKIKDEMVIYVPKFGEQLELTATTTSEGTTSNSEVKVNINTASSEELQTIPGIGPSKASAIIEYRDQKGLFKQVEDIKNISGIGDKTFEKLKDSITIE